MLAFITNTFGSWMYAKIEAFLLFTVFILMVISFWFFRLYTLIPFAIIFLVIFRFIDKTASYLVIR